MFIFLKYIHLLSISVWIGAIIFFSFVGAPTIFRLLDRSTAGDVVGAIFPQYYTISLVCSFTSLITLILISHRTSYSFHAKAGILILLFMGATTLCSTYVVWPITRQVKQQIRVETDKENLAQLKMKFSKYHGISMLLNMGTLALGVVLLVFTLQYIGLQQP
ncbi:MAG TPA: DUF4149 domain-containing protein [Nitrospinota bacterium]|nr:DUF4149 domain-containing protein [Nitrospinota bacterium]|tara:strand:+ start:3542 stop:4027 length:486 start_codon:yes stop_codon:yes gene_type:complete